MMDSFLCITDIPAETIEGAIKFLSEKDLHILRLCAFGSDGASVMTGRLSGVAVRLTRHSPRMIAVHCVNHRLALAAAHASDSIPYLKQLSLNHCSISTRTVQYVWLVSIQSKKY